MKKKIAKIISGTLLLLVVVLAVIFFYVKGHKEEVVNFIVESVLDKHEGEISFDDITLRSWGNFTNPAFYIKNMVLLDSTGNKVNRFEAEDIFLNLNVKRLLRDKIQVKSVRIKNAKYSSVISKEDLTTLSDDVNTPSEQPEVAKIFKPYKMSFDIHNFNIDIQNRPRKKRINFNINELSSKLLISPDKISTSLNLDANVAQLGFNLEKGNYLEDSKVSGVMKPEIHFDSNKIEIPTFDLSINDQTFKFSANFDISKESGFLFKIINEETIYDPTVKLLPENIQLKLKKYQIKQPFYTNTTIQGSFAPFSNPMVHVEFNSVENSAIINERFNLDNVSYKGSVTNRIYDDERAKTEDKRDLKLQFESVSGNYKETTFKLTHGELISTPEHKSLVKGILLAEGAPGDIISLTNTPVFNLKGGHYKLKADLLGDATSSSDLLTHSKITLNVENTSIFDNESKLSIPVKELNINVKEDLAKLNGLKLLLSNEDHLYITGEVSRFSSIIDKGASQPAITSIHLKSDKLKWKDFENIFKHPNKGASKRAKKSASAVHDLAQKIHLNFYPSVTVDINKFRYKAFQLNNFSTELFYSDLNHLHLNNTSFKLGEGLFKLNASLDFEQPHKILMDVVVDAQGSSEVLNKISRSDIFYFKDGKFKLHGQVNGDLIQMESFSKKLQGNLRLENSSIFYKPNDITIPIAILDVEIENNLTILNSLELQVSEENKIKIDGRLENFDAFLSSSNTNQVNTFVNLYSKRLHWQDFTSFFQKGVKNENSASEEILNKRLKGTLQEIHTKFNPKLNLNIESFEYNEMIEVDNFLSGLYIDAYNNLVFENCIFDYNKGSKVECDAKVDISDSEGTYVDIDFNVFGDPLHLNEILNYDTFLLNDGHIAIDAKIRGDIENVSELVSTSSAKFKIENSTLVHNPSQVSIPFNVFEIDLEKNNAVLKSMIVQLPSGDLIELSGELNNMTSLMPGINVNNKRLSSNFNIYSSSLDFSDFMGLFKSNNLEADTKDVNDKHPLKAIAKDFYNKYQPELSINLDEFKFNELIFHNFKTGFYFENENLLYLENTAFDFYKGKVVLDAHLDITDTYETDFSFGVQTERVNFEKLLISFDYFDVPSIKEAEHIGGYVSMNTWMEGRIIDSTGVIPSSLKGAIDFKLLELELKGFEPIINVGNTVFKKKRFEDIRFAPIESTLYLANNTVEFPLMEIQSTGFDFFVAGHMGYAEIPTNLWMAIPLSNFKSRDITNIPDKKEYIKAGKKIYVEAKTGKKDKLKYKLHLSDNQYFKERDSLGVYKKIIKENRLLRKEYKRESRRERNLVKPDKRQVHY